MIRETEPRWQVRVARQSFVTPWLVIEILSPSTAPDDVTDKLGAYRSISQLTHYVAIYSRRRAMRIYARVPDGSFATAAPLDRLMLPTLGEHGLSMDEIYRDTAVPHRRNI